MEDIFEQISKLDPKNWEAPVLVLTLIGLGLVLYIIYKNQTGTREKGRSVGRTAERVGRSGEFGQGGHQ